MNACKESPFILPCHVPVTPLGLSGCPRASPGNGPSPGMLLWDLLLIFKQPREAAMRERQKCFNSLPLQWWEEDVNEGFKYQSERVTVLEQ